MSAEAWSYVLNQKVGNPTAKLVLLGYANHAHKDGTCAFAGQETIAEYAECSVRTVQRHLNYLLARGFIRRGDQRLVAHYRRDRRPVVYNLSMSLSARQQWAEQYRPKPLQTRHSSRGTDVTKSRGDKLTPRTPSASPQVTRGDKMSPRGERGDRKTLTEATQLCRTNQDLNQPPPPTPSHQPHGPNHSPTAEAEENFTNHGQAAEALTADLPGDLTNGQRQRLTTDIANRMASGWTIDQLRHELTTGIDSARSPAAIYLHRLRHLSVTPLPASTQGREATKPTGTTHAFVPVPDDDWCGQCHLPASNGAHATHTAQTECSKDAATPEPPAVPPAVLAA